MMHKDLLVELTTCIDHRALKFVRHSLQEFCQKNHVSFEDALKAYIDVYLTNTNER